MADPIEMLRMRVSAPYREVLVGNPHPFFLIRVPSRLPASLPGIENPLKDLELAVRFIR